MSSNEVPALVDALKAAGQRVAFAESCTGGLLASWWTQCPGVSKVFNGSAVVYADSTKVRVLRVQEASLRQNGAVSEQVALEMARGVSETFESEWGVSITGVAGPDGGSPQKPVGTVCFSLVGPGVEQTWTRHFPGGRGEVQMAAAAFANECLREALNKQNN